MAATLARSAGSRTEVTVAEVCHQAGTARKTLSARLRSRARFGRVSGQSFQTDGHLECVGGVASPVQVQAPELLAEFLADSFRQRPCAALRLRVARRADARRRAR